MKRLLVVFLVLIGIFCFLGCGQTQTSDVSEKTVSKVGIDDVLCFDIPKGFDRVNTMKDANGNVVQHSWKKENDNTSALWYATFLTRDGEAVLDGGGLPMGIDGTISDYLALYKKDGEKPDRVIDLENIDTTAYVFENKNAEGDVDSISAFIPYQSYVISFDAFVGINDDVSNEDAEHLYSISKKDKDVFYKALASVSTDENQ